MIGIAVATVGILVLVSRGDPGRLGWLEGRGNWLVFISCFTWAGYTVLTRDISRRHNPLAVTASVLTLAGGLILVYLLATADWRVYFRLPAEGVAAAIFLGPICSALGFWFWQRGVAGLGAARTGFFLYLEPLATTALAVPYLREPFTVATAAGGLLVLAGVYLAERNKTGASGVEAGSLDNEPA